MHLPRIEKDPFIQSLTNNVLDKITEISKPEPGKAESPQADNIRLITPEEALSELKDILEMEN